MRGHRVCCRCRPVPTGPALSGVGPALVSANHRRLVGVTRSVHGEPSGLPATGCSTPGCRAPKPQFGLWTGTSRRPSAIIQRGFLAPLHRLVSDPRPRRVLPTHEVCQGHRDHGAPAPGACSRTPAACTCPVSASRSSHPRCTQPIAPSSTVAVVPCHARHAAAITPRSGQTQMAAMEEATWPGPTADDRRTG